MAYPSTRQPGLGSATVHNVSLGRPASGRTHAPDCPVLALCRSDGSRHRAQGGIRSWRRSGRLPNPIMPALAPCRWMEPVCGALGDSVCGHDSIDTGLRAEEAVDTCHHGADVARDRSAGYEVEGFLLAEPRSGVRCSARGVTAGHE